MGNGKLSAEEVAQLHVFTTDIDPSQVRKEVTGQSDLIVCDEAGIKLIIAGVPSAVAAILKDQTRQAVTVMNIGQIRGLQIPQKDEIERRFEIRNILASGSLTVAQLLEKMRRDGISVDEF